MIKSVGGIIFVNGKYLVQLRDNKKNIFFPGFWGVFGGLVEKGSVLKNENGTLRFQVTDGINSITVFYKGILPDLFSEGQGMVATGIYKNDVFFTARSLTLRGYLRFL